MKRVKVPKLRFKADGGSEFPEWEEKRLGDVGTVAMCKRVFKEQTSENGEVPFFKIGTFGDKPDAYISYKLFDELKTKYPYPQKGTVLLSASGTVGRQVIYNGEDAYYQDSNIVWLEHDATIMDGFLKQFYSIVKWKGLEGSTIKRLYNKTILDTMFYLPSLPEQQKIASFLSTIDEIIQSTESELTAWQERKKGVMQKIFNREVRFKADDGSEFPEWEEKRLSDIVSIHARIGWQGLRREEFLNKGEYYLITGTDFVDGKICFLRCNFIGKERYEQDVHIQIKNGDILITKDGTIGKVALVENLDKPATLNAGIFVLRFIVNGVVEYLYQYLNGPYMLDYSQKHSTGGTIKHLNQGVLVNFPVPFPSFLEQKKIADCLSSLDDVISNIQAELSAWKEFKKGLLQQMFV